MTPGKDKIEVCPLALPTPWSVYRAVMPDSQPPLPSPGSWTHLLSGRSSGERPGSFTVGDHGILSPARWPTVLRVWTAGLLVPWLSAFDFDVISFLFLISSGGKGEMAYEYILNLSEAKGYLCAKSRDNDLLHMLLNTRCSAGTLAL